MFADGKADTSKHLTSDGARLDIRGGYRVAHWSGGKLHFDPTYGNVSQTVAKATARAVAPMDIAADSQWILPETTRKRIAKRNPVVRRHKTVAEMRAAGVPDYFEKIQKWGTPHRPSTMLYESGEQRPVAGHAGHFILSSAGSTALMHRRPVGSDPDDTEITVRGLYDVYGRRKNPATGKVTTKRNPRLRPFAHKISDKIARNHAHILADLTADNDHAGAMFYLAADVLQSPTYADKIRAINERHVKRGYLTEADNSARYALYQRMIAQVKRRTSPDGYAAIYGAL
jgi:hypothetical protein